VLLAVGAYGAWGLLTLYWPLLEPAGPLEILAVRVIFSLLFILLLLAWARDFGWVRPLLRDPRRRRLVILASGLIAVNWGAFITAVISGQVLQSSFGYFITPLVSTALGVLVLRERLRPVGWVAVGLGVLAVIVLGIGYGGLPWIALALALSFGVYGLVKKQLGMAAAPSLAAETAVLLLPALAFLTVLLLRGEASLIGEPTGPLTVLAPDTARLWHVTLMVGAGAVTALPLLMFTGAATRVPLSWLGPLSYLTPTIQFFLALLLFDEAMSPARWWGFALVWVGLLLIAADSWRRRRQRTRPAGRRSGRAGEHARADLGQR